MSSTQKLCLHFFQEVDRSVETKQTHKMPDETDPSSAAPPFSIGSSSPSSAAGEFENKRKMLFESLNSAEKCIKGTTLEQKNIRPPNKLAILSPDDSSIGRKFQGRESIFKKPELSLTKCLKPKRTPDYQVSIIIHNWDPATPAHL